MLAATAAHDLVDDVVGKVFDLHWELAYFVMQLIIQGFNRFLVFDL